MNDRAVPNWLTATTYAHRGLHKKGIPENSLAAAEAAIAAGLGIECDIQRSRDDHPMVFHDWELSRLTRAQGETQDWIADDLETFRLLDTDQTPIRLERFLDTVAVRTPLLIEIKSQPGYDVERTCRCVSRILAKYTGPVALMSFDARVGHWFAEHDPTQLRGLVGTDSLKNGFASMWRDPDFIKQADPDFLAVDVRDLERPEAAQWRFAGKPLLTWTVRTAEDRARGLAHADALIAEGEGFA